MKGKKRGKARDTPLESVERGIENVVMHRDHLKLRLVALVFAIAASNSLLLFFLRTEPTPEAHALATVANLVVITILGVLCFSQPLLFSKALLFGSVVSLEATLWFMPLPQAWQLPYAIACLLLNAGVLAYLLLLK